MPNISIIIPTLNEEYYLPRLLDSISRQDFDGDLEVIVVDGGSDDKTLEEARLHQAAIPGLRIFTAAKGISRQRNYGAQKATHHNLVFLDADAELPPGAIQKIAKKFSYSRDFCAIPILTPYDGKPVDALFVVGAYVYFTMVRFTRPIVSGMCIITTKGNHGRIGGFNEDAVFGEDIDYGLRSFRSGAKYRIFFDVRVRASARRLDQHGRLRLGITWWQWYREVVRHGAITDKSRYRYEFGQWKSRH